MFLWPRKLKRIEVFPLLSNPINKTCGGLESPSKDLTSVVEIYDLIDDLEKTEVKIDEGSPLGPTLSLAAELKTANW